MRQQQSVKVGLVQMKCVADRQSNLDRVQRLVAKCSEEGADIVCLQELSFDHYFCQSEQHQHFDLAEPVGGPLSDFCSNLAKKHSIVLLSGLFEKRAPGIYHNTFLVHESDGALVGSYRKTHIPDDPCYFEKFYFTPGDNGFPVVETSCGKLGVCICWDQWFPEAARLTALGGAEIIFFPTAIGWLGEDKEPYGESQLNAWNTMMCSHAIANGVFVAAPNRVGVEGEIEFWGNSFLADPYGNRIASVGLDEATLVAEIDLELIETARTHWPFLRDRRIDLYGDLTKRWRP